MTLASTSAVALKSKLATTSTSTLDVVSAFSRHGFNMATDGVGRPNMSPKCFTRGPVLREAATSWKATYRVSCARARGTHGRRTAEKPLAVSRDHTDDSWTGGTQPGAGERDTPKSWAPSPTAGHLRQGWLVDFAVLQDKRVEAKWSPCSVKDEPADVNRTINLTRSSLSLALVASIPEYVAWRLGNQLHHIDGPDKLGHWGINDLPSTSSETATEAKDFCTHSSPVRDRVSSNATHRT